MSKLSLQKNLLGFEVHYDDNRPLTLYRAREELPRTDSPKPCFAPIYTFRHARYGVRPSDHTWHAGLYFGWCTPTTQTCGAGPGIFQQLKSTARRRQPRPAAPRDFLNSRQAMLFPYLKRSLGSTLMTCLSP